LRHRDFGEKPNKYWHDHKGAMVNAIRTRKGVADADVVVVRFGEHYKQWNAAFDAGYAAALGKSLIILQRSPWRENRRSGFVRLFSDSWKRSRCDSIKRRFHPHGQPRDHVHLVLFGGRRWR
jgi:hypothetical protein